MKRQVVHSLPYAKRFRDEKDYFHGPSTSFTITPGASVANSAIVSEYLSMPIQLATTGYCTKTYMKVYGKGCCPIHGYLHSNNNWFVAQPIERTYTHQKRKHVDTLPNAFIGCYHEFGSIIKLNGPILL